MSNENKSNPRLSPIYNGFKNTVKLAAVIDLIKAVEQVTQTCPLQSWGWVERVEASSKGVVALLQHSFKQGQRL